MSIYIPHVFPNIDEERIMDIFQKLGIGQVSYVDFIGKFDRNGNVYNAVYVHFDHWRVTQATINLQKKILDPTQEARLVYDDPWYWVLLENTGKKQVINGRKPCINLDFEDKKPEEDQTTWSNDYFYYQEPQQEEFVALNYEEVRARVNEICDYLLLHGDNPTRRETILLGDMSKELSLLEDSLVEYNNQEDIEQSITTIQEPDYYIDNLAEELLDAMDEAESEWKYDILVEMI